MMTTQFERELVINWKADGLTKEEIARKLAARRERVANKPLDGEAGPALLAKLFW